MRILQEVPGKLVGQAHGLALGDAVVEDQAGDEDGGQHGSDDTDDERRGEALDRTGTEDVEDDTGEEGGHLAVDDGGVGILVTVDDGLGEALARGQLFLDTLIDDHVRIHGHTQGQDETGDTREGEDGAEGHEGSEEQEDVAQEGDVGDETGTLVEEHHVDEHQDEGDQEGDETGADGSGTEGRAHDLLLDDGGRSRELTGLEDVRKVLSLLHVEVAGDLGAAAGDLVQDVRVGIHEAVEDDGDLLADVVLGEVGPGGSAFGVHRHGHVRSAAAAVAAAVEFDAGVGHDTAVERGLAVTGGSLDGDELVDVRALDILARLHGPETAEALREDILRHGEVPVHHHGIDTVGEADAGVVHAAGLQDGEERVGDGGAVAEVREDLRDAGVDGIEVHLVGGEGGPELEGGGTLQELADTLRILDARELDEDLAAVLDALDVRLGDAETVDTVAEHVEGVVDGALRFVADDLDDFLVGGFRLHLVAELVGAEDLGEPAAVRGLGPGAFEQADEILAGVHVVLLRQIERFLEVGIGAVAGEGLHEILELDLQHDVHAALEVEAEVDLLLLGGLVGVSEINLLSADGVDVGTVPDVGHRVQDELADFGGDVVRVNELLGSFGGDFGSFLLLDAGDRGEGELPEAGQGKQDGEQSD